MLHCFRHVSPMITACALTAILSASFVADGTVTSRQDCGRTDHRQSVSVLQPGTGIRKMISILQPGIAAAQAEWDFQRYNNAADSIRNTETYITGREVFIRPEPTINSTPLGVFRFGEPVRVKEDLGEWLKVEYLYSDKPVYVHKTYVGSWNDVKDKYISTSDCMIKIDWDYDRLNMAAPFNTKEPDWKLKLKEIEDLQGLLEFTESYIQSSKLPKQTIDDMLKAVKMINDMYTCQKRFITEPEQADNLRDEAWPDLQEQFREYYVTLDKYR